jgi:hypothetical protein
MKENWPHSSIMAKMVQVKISAALDIAMSGKEKQT